MKQPHARKYYATIASVVLLTVAMPLCCRAQESAPAWDAKREAQHLHNRQDPTKWDRDLLRRDLERIKEGKPAEPIADGAFPVPRYELLGKEAFKGVGNGGDFSGIDQNGRKILYAFFFANRNAINKAFVGAKPNEVFFSIVVLTDFVDTVNFTHAGALISSRNNPDYIGEGFFKTKNGRIDYAAFLTAGRDEYAIVNMRLFNLKHGRTVLIAPQRDGSLRSRQIASPVLSDEEVKGFIDKLLKQGDVKEFYTDNGNL